MGGVCTCSKEGEALATLDPEDKGLVAGDKIGRATYVGELYKHDIVEQVKGAGVLHFAEPTGDYADVKTVSKFSQISSLPTDPKPRTSSKGSAVLRSNLQFELGMFLPKKVFHNQRIALRVRLEINGAKDTETKQLAALQVKSMVSGKDVEIYKAMPVYGFTNFVDFYF